MGCDIWSESEDFRRRGAVSRSSICRPRRRLRHTFAHNVCRDAAVHRSRGRLYVRLFPVLCTALLSAIEAHDVALGGIRAHRTEGQADIKSMRCERFWYGDKKRTTVSSARTEESSVPLPPLADALHLQETLGSLQSKLRAGFVSGVVQVLFLIYGNIFGTPSRALSRQSAVCTRSKCILQRYCISRGGDQTAKPRMIYGRQKAPVHTAIVITH
jgi:hypothetical protein